ncbi:transcription initiation factor TFIID subunit 7-like [Peromyscus californicus insignis]|uniref:transcription initiation factor TFIID subunit 7-like n=1 Tax=Peromyscus californicus insignis TaxID=564181 RepID=UPI0022A6F0D3|nr:transcription initiation factor TFIID subunit 7-like [Peromyscus californicus insignis]
MSENHDHDDDDQPPPELENQFILRLPPEQAARVRQIIRSGNAAVRERLKIDLSPDARHAVLQVDDVSLSARVVDLPCVIGSLKTHDRKTFYKTADISQMLVCSAEGDPRSSPEEPAPAAGATALGHQGETGNKYIWKHGITPPLKNVRKKRFRKPTRKLPDVKQSEGCGGYIDSKDVEKEVKRLLRSDAEAISSRWEITVDDDTKAVQSPTCIPGLPVPTEISGHSSSECAVPQNTFRDSSRQDDDQGKDENKDEDEEEEGDEEKEEEKEDDTEEDLERELQTKFIEFSLCEAKEDCSSVILGIQKLIHYKEKKLQKIQGKAQRQKDLLGKLENLTLKSHFQSELEQLKLQEKQKYEQIIFLQEQLKYFVKK